MLDLNKYHPPGNLLKDRVILITGSSRGLGRACAMCFASFGATIVLHGKSPAGVEAVYDEILDSNGAEPYGISLDFDNANEHDFVVMATEIEKNLGRLDGIVHSAVFATELSPLADKSLRSWQSTMNINVIAPTAIDRACRPLLVEAPDASLIYVSENHVDTAPAYWGQMAVSKNAVETLAKTQAREMEKNSTIRVNIVVPGPIRTNSHQTAYPGDLPDNQVSPGQVMTPFLFLAGPDSKNVNGQRLYAQARTCP